MALLSVLGGPNRVAAPSATADADMPPAPTPTPVVPLCRLCETQLLSSAEDDAPPGEPGSLVALERRRDACLSHVACLHDHVDAILSLQSEARLREVMVAAIAVTSMARTSELCEAIVSLLQAAFIAADGVSVFFCASGGYAALMGMFIRTLAEFEKSKVPSSPPIGISDEGTTSEPESLNKTTPGPSREQFVESLSSMIVGLMNAAVCRKSICFCSAEQKRYEPLEGSSVDLKPLTASAEGLPHLQLVLLLLLSARAELAQIGCEIISKLLQLDPLASVPLELSGCISAVTLLIKQIAMNPSYLPRGSVDVPWLIQLSESVVIDATSSRTRSDRYGAYGYSTAGAAPKGTWEKLTSVGPGGIDIASVADWSDISVRVVSQSEATRLLASALIALQMVVTATAGRGCSPVFGALVNIASSTLSYAVPDNTVSPGTSIYGSSVSNSDFTMPVNNGPDNHWYSLSLGSSRGSGKSVRIPSLCADQYVPICVEQSTRDTVCALCKSRPAFLECLNSR
jgi:hypothetical protein